MAGANVWCSRKMTKRSQIRRRRSGFRQLRGGFRSTERAGMETLQLGECAEVGALGGVNSALQTGECVDTATEDVAESGVVQGVVGFFSFDDLVLPKLGFDAVKTAQLPIRMEECIDQETLKGIRWLELLTIACGQGFEFGGIFAGNHVGRHGSLDSENTRRFAGIRRSADLTD